MAKNSNTFERCGSYGRYSTNMQRMASLEDQERSVREAAAAKGWMLLDEHIYTDKARSGTRIAGRDGLIALLQAAKSKPRPFDRIIVDDTSRLGRDLADVLDIVKQLRSCGVAVYFVSQNMDSRDEQTFDLFLSIFGAFDQQQITRLRKRVRQGLEGRFLNGYNAGSVAYGYESVKEKSGDTSAIGHGSFNGSRLVIIESEAAVIKRIFTWFVEGKGPHKIAKMLNIEGVPWPHVKHGKWGPTAVKVILRNTKYKGVSSFGLSKQVTDYATGSVKKEKPESEPLWRMDESIRIISDALWNKAAERLEQMAGKQQARRQGGYNRSENGTYLYSGLIVCGVCGRNMVMGGRKGGGVYECVDHRHGGGCTNSLRIRETLVAKQISDTLSTQLLLPNTLSYLSSAVFRELKIVLEEQKKDLKPEYLEHLVVAKAECMKKISNLVEAIEDTGLESLRHRLAVLEFERDRINAELRTVRAAQDSMVTEDELHTLLEQNVRNLFAALKSKPEMARAVLQRHMKRLMFYPDVSGGRAVFHVVGEMDLFNQADEHQYIEDRASSNDGVLLGCFGTLAAEQHTVDLHYSFILEMDTKEDDPCLLLEPFCQLLAAHPELSMHPLRPKEWAQHLGPYIPAGQKMPGSGAVGRIFWRYRMELAERLVIIKVPNSADPGHSYQVSLRNLDAEHGQNLISTVHAGVSAEVSADSNSLCYPN